MQRLLVAIVGAFAMLALVLTWAGGQDVPLQAVAAHVAPDAASSLSLLEGAAGGRAANQPRAAAGASVGGRVVRDDGAPVAGACVRTAAGETVTDAAGCYLLTGLPTGRTQLTASAPGLIALPIRPLSLVPDARVEGVDLVLTTACRVAGRVIDARGAALAGVEVGVVLREVEHGDGHLRKVPDDEPQVAVTTADGAFTLGSFPRGVADITAAGPAWLPFARRCRTDAAGLTIVLAQANLLTGEVVAADSSQPVAIAEVLLRTDGNAGRPGHLVGRFVPEPADAAAGRFCVPVATLREFVVHVTTRAAGPAQSEPLRAVPGQPFAPLRLRTEPAFALRLQLVDDASQPVCGARVAIHDPGLHGECATATSDGAGWLLIAPLREGRYELRVQADGHRPATRPIELPGHAPASRWVLERGGQVTGTTVGVPGAVMAADEVVAWTADGLCVAARTKVAAGRFRLGFLPPGDYLVGLSTACGGEPARPLGATVRLARGSVADVRLDPAASGLASLQGRIRCHGADVGAVRVELCAAARVLATAWLDWHGSFAFGAVPPGSIDVRVVLADGEVQVHRQSVQLAAGEVRQIDAEVPLGGLHVDVPEGVDLELRDRDGGIWAAGRSRSGRGPGWPCVLAGEWTLAARRAAAWQLTTVWVTAGRTVWIAPRVD